MGEMGSVRPGGHMTVSIAESIEPTTYTTRHCRPTARAVAPRQRRSLVDELPQRTPVRVVRPPEGGH